MSLLIWFAFVLVMSWFIASYNKVKEQHEKEQLNEEMKQLGEEYLNEETFVKAMRKAHRKIRLLNLKGPLEYRGIYSVTSASYIYDLYDENPINFIRFMELYEADKVNKSLDNFSDDLINSIIIDLQNKIIKSNFKGVVFDPESLYLVVEDYHKLKQSDGTASEG